MVFRYSGKTATKLTVYAYLILKTYKSNTLYNAWLIPNSLISILTAGLGSHFCAWTTDEIANRK